MTSLTSSMISQVERGGISPSIDTLKKIANALNVSVGYFFEDEADAAARILGIPLESKPDQETSDLADLDIAEKLAGRPQAKPESSFSREGCQFLLAQTLISMDPSNLFTMSMTPAAVLAKDFTPILAANAD